MARISIALATFNGARFIEEQLQTLADQALRPFELIVADDGSADDTVEIVADFAKAAPFPVKILPGGGRLGYRLNFRRAANACTGDLIAFCDQDDAWYPEKLSVMASVFDDPAVMLAYHNAVVVSGDSRHPLYIDHVEQSGLRHQPFKASNGLLQVFRAELCKFDSLWDRSVDHNEGDVILAHDQWYFFLADLLGEVRFIDRSLLDYRQHGTNTYGAKARDTAWRRLAGRFVHFGDQDRWGARGAAARAEIATLIAKEDGRPDLLRRAEEYRKLSERLARRAETYSARGLPVRLVALLKAYANEDYGGGRWQFPIASVLRDVWSGVVLRKDKDHSRAVSNSRR